MPDLSRLVRRVSEAMGPTATPERVEAVARAVLDELTQHPAVRAGSGEAADRLAVVVVGYSDERLARALEDVLSDAGCKVLGYDVPADGPGQLVIRASTGGTAVTISELRRRADAVAAQFGACADVQHEALFLAMHPMEG
ncbi:MAG: hypothetical protein R3178_07390 [Rhodothermales bacterium]|nr:hypothetical protein [Rhodothermales bacterium]